MWHFTTIDSLRTLSTLFQQSKEQNCRTTSVGNVLHFVACRILDPILHPEDTLMEITVWRSGRSHSSNNWRAHKRSILPIESRSISLETLDINFVAFQLLRTHSGSTPVR